MADAVEKTHAGSGLGRGKAPIKAAIAGGSSRRGLRHKQLKNNINGITTPAIRRLARRGGVKRIEATIYDCTRSGLRDKLTKIILDACTYVDYSRRKTLKLMHIDMASKHNGITLYHDRIMEASGAHEKPVKKITLAANTPADAGAAPAPIATAS